MHATDDYRLRDHIFESSQGIRLKIYDRKHLSLMQGRAEFHKNQGVGKKDFGTIEYLLRRGRRQLETYQDPGIRDLH